MAAGDRRTWPWVVAIAVGVVGAWVLLELVDTTRPPEPAESTIPVAPVEQEPTTPPAPDEPVSGAAAEDVIDDIEDMRAAVRRYESECAHRPDPVSGTRERNVVAVCLDRLAMAIGAVLAADTVAGLDADDRLARYRRQAEELRRSAPGAGYSGEVREALISSADLLATIQEQLYPETLGGSDAVEDLQAVAAAVDPHRPVDAQQETLTAFFRDAAPILSAMARPSDPGPENGTR